MGAEEIAGAEQINVLRNLVLEALRNGAADQDAIVERIRKKRKQYSSANISEVVWSLILENDIELKPGMRLEVAAV
jgi:hypothetical protein